MDEDPDVDDLGRRMDGAIAVLRQEFASLRTGRATTAMLDPITVEAYGARMPLNQLATINIPEPRMITLNVWDRSQVGAVEKALRASDLGINPVVDGTLIRLPVPEVTEDRRKELARVAGRYAEQARVAIRNVRRDGMDQLRKLKADGMSEDDHRLWQDEIQTLTDEHVRGVDETLAAKQKEILRV